jgi:Phosphotransferase enzyme family
MIPAGDPTFARRCEELVPGFVAQLPVRRARKSELLVGEVAGQRVVAKRLRQPNPIWAWYLAREAAIYRAFADAPPGVRVPRFVAAADDIVIVEWLPGEPIATTRQPRAALPPATVARLIAIRDALAAWPGRAPDTPPDPRMRVPMRDRLLEDPTAPVEWVRDGIRRCGQRDVIPEPAARRIVAAIAAHSHVTFGHGDLLLRNAIADGDDVVLVDWECAGPHLHDWDLALLWIQLAPDARAPLEHHVRDGGAARWRAFLGIAAFAIAREIRFQRAFGARESPHLRDELAGVLAQL